MANSSTEKSMQRIIRPYKNDDLDALLDVWENASKIGHPFLTAEFLKVERENIATLYLPASDTWVLEQDHAVIGFISLLDNEVGGLFVQPQFHGTGAGRALMDKAKELHSNLVLEVFEANSVGRYFYAKAGFELLQEKIDEETGHKALRLKFSAKKPGNKSS